MVVGNNPGWIFLDNNLPEEEEEDSESVELTKSEIIAELERQLKVEKGRSKMASLFFYIIFNYKLNQSFVV